MTLHVAMEAILREHGSPQKAAELERRIAAAGTYTRRDEGAPPAEQILRRARKYKQLFRVEGSQIHLVGASSAPRPVPAPVAPPAESSEYHSVRDFEARVPALPGLYVIRLRDADRLPAPFAGHLTQRGDGILYVGQASTTLTARLAQELRAHGHGTFFRSLGAMLGYLPPRGSLVGKRNQRNYRFAKADEQAIIAWLDAHAEVAWHHPAGDLDAAEQAMIHALRPLMNLQGNPEALRELSDARRRCVDVACEES